MKPKQLAIPNPSHDVESGQFTPKTSEAETKPVPPSPKMAAAKQPRDYDPETVRSMAYGLGYSPKEHKQGDEAFAKGHIRGKFTQDNYDELYDLYDRNEAPHRSMKYVGKGESGAAKYVPWESEEEKKKWSPLSKQDWIRRRELMELAEDEYNRDLDEDEPETEFAQRSRASDLWGLDLSEGPEYDDDKDYKRKKYLRALFGFHRGNYEVD